MARERSLQGLGDPALLLGVPPSLGGEALRNEGQRDAVGGRREQQTRHGEAEGAGEGEGERQEVAAHRDGEEQPQRRKNHVLEHEFVTALVISMGKILNSKWNFKIENSR